MTYRITKYAQSCFLLEKDGVRCLIDPGRFGVEMDGMKPEDWPKVDVVLVTHDHGDHAHPETLGFLAKRDHCIILTNAAFAKTLAELGIPARAVAPNEHVHAGGFHVTCVAQQHGDLPNGNPAPVDIGFIVDSVIYTPGDAIPSHEMPQVPVFFVPVAGPEMNFLSAEKMIETVKPELAIPMHYANTKNYPIDMEELLRFSVAGTRIVVLDDRQSIDWPMEQA